LEEEVRAGRFREDLYYRLCVAKVELPPLRDRPREIPLLAQMFLKEAGARQGRESTALSPPALTALARHTWPGNVRELKNTMDLLAATVEEEIIELRHLPKSLAQEPLQVPDPEPEPQPIPPSKRAASRGSEFLPLAEEVESLERARIKEALDATNGVKAHAAALLGMPIRTFVEKYKKFGFPERPTRTPK
jgi:DNA-binding NtrC family response regulator